MKLKAFLTDLEKNRLTLQNFLNLSKNAVNIVQSADAVGKDIICRQIFANFVVDVEKVASYRLKEPFDTLMKQRKFLSGRGGEI